ncbi:MAG: HAD family hydrolase [Pseudomonadota bacterium]
MALALFDLDDTLIVGNCETNWFEYLIEQGHYDGSTFADDIAEFDRQYESGAGDINDYMYFVLKPLVHHPLATLEVWRQDWFEKSGKAMIARGARAKLEEHREASDTLVIISASNRFCVEPFANEFGVDHFMCSIPEIVDDRYTGVFLPPACFGAGKLTHLDRWLETSGHSMENSFFYSDSRNDIPLLERADNPIAVNADGYLTRYAQERNWPHLNLR